eukprot:m51a1_g2550 hypothetical protein (541) ;mRNA; r:312414-314036
MRGCVLLLSVLAALSQSKLYDAVLEQWSGQTTTKTGGTLFTSADDTSGACAYHTGSLIVLNGVNITTTGGTSNGDQSSFYGLNAGVLASHGGEVRMTNVTILTTGKGANGAFACNGTMTIANSTIICYASLGHGVDSTVGGTIRIDNVDIVTYGEHGAALSNDRGGGTVIAYGGRMRSEGQGSPGIYSTGTIETHGSHLEATNTEAATIEGRNVIGLYDGTYIKGVCQGVKIYCSTSGDASFGRATLTIKQSTLELSSTTSAKCITTSRALIYVDGTNDQEAQITVEDSQLVSSFGTVLWAINGANVLFNAVSQNLTGNVLASSTTTAALSLATSSVLAGRTNGVSLAIDSSSMWNVTGQSFLTGLTSTGTIALAKTAATITVTGKAVIGGTLQLPQSFQKGTFTVVAAAAVTGKFASVEIDGTGRTVSASYTSTAVAVTVGGDPIGDETADTDDISINDTDTTPGGSGMPPPPPDFSGSGMPPRPDHSGSVPPDVPSGSNPPPVTSSHAAESEISPSGSSAHLIVSAVAIVSTLVVALC